MLHKCEITKLWFNGATSYQANLAAYRFIFSAQTFNGGLVFSSNSYTNKANNHISQNVVLYF